MFFHAFNLFKLEYKQKEKLFVEISVNFLGQN